LSCDSIPVAENKSVHKAWDKPIVSHFLTSLLQNANDDYTIARLLAVSSPHASDWLNAVPLSSVGLRMDNDVIRIAAGLRIGSSVCSPHTCQCGNFVDARGNHGLACIKSAGRHLRHSLVNDIIAKALSKIGLAAVREPPGLVIGSGLRPDGVTLIPWARGKPLAWDATIPDTLAASHLRITSQIAGAAASDAQVFKTNKYRDLLPSHIFMPVAVETMGSWTVEGLGFIKDLGRRISAITGDLREAAFLFQRLSVAIQQGNAASVFATLPQFDTSD
jgi:hypothetical protein